MYALSVKLAESVYNKTEKGLTKNLNLKIGIVCIFREKMKCSIDVKEKQIIRS